MKINNILFKLMFFMLSIACSTNDSSINTIHLTPDTTISKLSDSSYIHDVSSVFFYNNHYYISDYERSQVFILNNHMEMIQIIGQKGKGPGEFIGADHVFVIDSLIYTKNDYKRSIEKYNFNNNHIETINFPLSFNMISYLRFYIDSHSIFMASNCGKNLVAAFTYTDNSIIRFGDVKQFNTQRETSIKNDAHLIKHNDFIIAIPEARAEVIVFDQYGKLIKNFNYEHIAPVSKLMKFIKRQPVRENSYYVVASDVYMNNNLLYILLLTVDDDNKTNKNNILEIEINETTILPKKIYNLGNGWFETFCVTDESLLTFNRLTGSLVKFNIDNN